MEHPVGRVVIVHITQAVGENGDGTAFAPRQRQVRKEAECRPAAVDGIGVGAAQRAIDLQGVIVEQHRFAEGHFKGRRHGYLGRIRFGQNANDLRRFIVRTLVGRVGRRRGDDKGQTVARLPIAIGEALQRVGAGRAPPRLVERRPVGQQQWRQARVGRAARGIDDGIEQVVQDDRSADGEARPRCGIKRHGVRPVAQCAVG